MYMLYNLIVSSAHFIYLLICRKKLYLYILNCLRPRDAYMHLQTCPSLVKMMACRLIGAKPLLEPMLPYCLLDHKEHNSVKFSSKFIYLHSWKCLWMCRLENGGHFSRSQCGRSLHHLRTTEKEAFLHVSLFIVKIPLLWHDKLWATPVLTFRKTFHKISKYLECSSKHII